MNARSFWISETHTCRNNPNVVVGWVDIIHHDNVIAALLLGDDATDGGEDAPTCITSGSTSSLDTTSDFTGTPKDPKHTAATMAAA